jgi:AcrR family transcriptional regulator
MLVAQKRSYNSEARRRRAYERRDRILKVARALFSKKGIEKTTIGMIAEAAKTAPVTVYAIFKSKEGILIELANRTLFQGEFQSHVDKLMVLTDSVETLRMAARITRTVLDAGDILDLLRGAMAISPKIRKLESNREKTRYETLYVVVDRLKHAHHLSRDLTVEKARDILWALTDRDLYVKLVLERKWSSDAYEEWLRKTLIWALMGDHKS